MRTIELLKKLVSIPSVFPKEEEIGRFIFFYLQNLGFEVKKVETKKKRFNLIAAYGHTSKYIGFYGHMDTVSRDEISENNPFVLKIKDDKAWGLGVEDMKGGVAAILKVAEFAIEEKLPVKIIMGVDEENISKGAHDLVNSGLLDDLSFLIVGESGQIENLNQPFNVCYGRKGRILYQVEVFGKKSHAAERHKGVNAIEQTNNLISEILKIEFPKHVYLGRAQIIITSIHADTTSFSIPDKCVFTFSLLTTPKAKGKEIEKHIIELAGKMKINMKIGRMKRETPYGESYEIDKDNRFLKELEKNILKPYKIKPIYASSVADENVFTNRLGIPVISIGPIGGGEHTKDEWVSLKSLRTVEEVYRKIIKLYSCF
ncbi:MAG: M20/M25/M40 family metallo-hydrolase [Candidatus Daviesbacteria bacterium]|nr:M20/M25/M40 family metallo-hydrolase [Candidatus Daviesbacteria bacterium]